MLSKCHSTLIPVSGSQHYLTSSNPFCQIRNVQYRVSGALGAHYVRPDGCLAAPLRTRRRAAVINAPASAFCGRRIAGGQWEQRKLIALAFARRWLKTQTQRLIAVICLVGLIHIAWRNMPRDQLLRSQVSPYIDVHAMTACNAKEALRLAHRCTDTLCPGVDQTDAGYKWLVGARNPVSRIGVLGFAQLFLEASIAGRSLIARDWS